MSYVVSPFSLILNNFNLISISDGVNMTLQQNLLMHSKIQKAKLINIHSRLSDYPDQTLPPINQEIRTIHTYFALLRHIFQRNKQTIRNSKPIVHDNNCVGSQKVNKIRYPSQKRTNSLKNNNEGTQHFITEPCEGQQQINYNKNNDRIHNRRASLMARKPTLKTDSSSIVCQQDKKKDDLATFTPIGEVYQKLKNDINDQDTETGLSEKLCTSIFSKISKNKNIVNCNSRKPSELFKCIQKRSNKNNQLLKRINTERKDCLEDQGLRGSYKSCTSLESPSYAVMPTPW